MFRTPQGLICQNDQDTGDTAQREGFYYFTQKKNWLFGDAVNYYPQALIDYPAAVKILEVQPGLWIRGPQYPDLKDMSRDQTDPNIICMGSMGLTDPLNRLFEQQWKRGFTYQNADIPMLLTFSLYIRAFKTSWLYPLLYIFDLNFLWCWIGALMTTNPDDVDDNNAIMRFLQAVETMPTLWSWLGRLAYTKCRRKNLGNTEMGENNTVMGALAWYHRAASGGNPEISEAYRPFIMKYFSQKGDPA